MEEIIGGYLQDVTSYQNEQYGVFPNSWYDTLSQLFAQFPVIDNVVQLPKEYYLYIKNNKIGNLKIMYFYEDYGWIYQAYSLTNQDVTMTISQESRDGVPRFNTTLVLKDKDYNIQNGDYVKLVYEEHKPIDEIEKTCIVRFDEKNACMVTYKNDEFSLKKLGGIENDL